MRDIPNLSTHPMLFPLVLLDLATEDTASLLKLRIKLLSQIQQRTGMDRFNSLKSLTIDGHKSVEGILYPNKEKERQDLDLDAIMLRLTCLSDWVAAQRGFIAIQRRIVQVVENLLTNDAPAFTPFPPNNSVDVMFTERLDFIRETLLAAEDIS